MSGQTETTSQLQLFLPASRPELAISFRLIKSRRKTYSITLEADGTLTLRTPLSMSSRRAKQLLSEKENWIIQKYTALQKKKAALQKQLAGNPLYALTETEKKALEKRLRKDARLYFEKRAAHYAQLLGVSYGSLTIRGQKTRWGSCSGRGNLSFNWRLMLAPPQVADYVAAHEVCHLKHMNHSPAFWQTVEQVFPGYRECRKWLRQNGDSLYI